MLDEKHVLIPYTNKLLKFNLENKKYTDICIGDKGDQFHKVLIYKECLWIIIKNKLAVIRWDIRNETTERFTDFPTQCKESLVCNFGNRLIHRIDDYLYCFPSMSNMAIKINLNNGKIEGISEMKRYCEANDLCADQEIFSDSVRYGDKIYLQYQKNLIISYNVKTKEVFEYQKEIAIDYECKEIKRIICKRLFERDNGGYTPQKMDGMAGKRIVAHTIFNTGVYNG